MKTLEEIEKVILERLQVSYDCSFAELDTAINDPGEYKLEHPHFDNIFLWVNMSQNYAEAVKSLLSKDKITVSPANPLVYLSDGKVIQLPQPTKAKSYKKPHWLPSLVKKGKNF
jgi:hypothetical protein